MLLYKKIIFLCGCIEPGKDGVGDYTRSLALEVAENGVESIIISINDPFINEYMEGEKTQGLNRVAAVKFYRIPSMLSLKEKSEIIRGVLLKFNPDFISIQLVPFAYNPYGILRIYIDFFVQILKGYKVSIMFHELWIGDSVDAGLKEKLLGFIGRKYILKLIGRLKPEMIQTTSDLNVFLLSKYKIKAFKLPVFSNIPIVNKTHDEFAKNLPQPVPLSKKEWTFVFFGTIHPDWNPDILMTTLLKIKKLKNLVFLIVSIGKTNSTIWDKMVKDYSTHFEFKKVGETTIEKISLYLQNADFGVSSYPDVLIEKSGSIAALRLHGLPVILSRDDLIIKGFTMDFSTLPLVLKVSDLEKYMEGMNGKSERDNEIVGLKEVTRKFLKEIQAINVDQ